MISFAEIKRRYSENPLPILRELVGAGEIRGGDYVALNPRRNDRHRGSFRIKISTGGFYDFASGDKGGSIIDLAAFVYNCGIIEAAERISGENLGQLKNRGNFWGEEYSYKSMGYAACAPNPQNPEKKRINPKFIWERSAAGDHPYLRRKKIQGTPGGGCFGKYTDTTVCREITKTDSEHRACAGDSFGKYTDTTVCREIGKAVSDTKGKPENSCTHNNRLQELPGARVNFYKGKSQLVIPLTDRVPDKSVPDKPEDFEIKGLQFIGEDGQKRFMGSVKGLFHLASSERIPEYQSTFNTGSKIILAEGYATARSIAESTDFFVVAGMSSCNMKNVAEKIAEQFPNSEIIIAADNDEAGRKAAAEALKAISGKVSCAAVYPSPEFNDFNDMYAAREAKAVKDCFDLAKPFAVCGENAAASRLEEMIHA